MPATTHIPATTDDWTAINELARSISTGEAPAEVLRHKRADVLVVRAPLLQYGSVIVKLWHRGGVKEYARRWLGRNEPWREARALERLNAMGVAVPKLIGRVRLTGSKVRHTHAIIVEDLGPCTRLVEHVGELAAAGNWDQLTPLESGVIAITAGMIEAGVLDLDHSLNNMLVPPTGVIARVDLEFAVRCTAATRRPRLYGTMLGRLIGTYTFAVQPRLDRVSDFSERLYDRVSPPKAVRRHARRYVAKMMAKQRQVHGIDCRPDLPA